MQKVDTKTKFANLIDVENLELAEDNKNGTSKLVVVLCRKLQFESQIKNVVKPKHHETLQEAKHH